MRLTQKLFPVLLCGTVLLAGCGRDAEQEEARVVGEETGQPAEADKGYVIEEPIGEAQEEAEAQETAELRREPVVDLGQAGQVPEEDSQAEELAAQERRLAQRQAELDARERELSRRERPQRPQRPSAADRTDPTDPTDRSDDTIGGTTAATDTAEITEPSRPAETEPEVEAPPEERAGRELPRPATSATSATTATVPTGTLMEVELLDRLATDTTRAGDTFRARIVSDLRSDDGRVAVPAGSEIVGVVDEVVPLRKVGGRAKMALRFTDLVLPSGTTVPIRASLVQEGRSETRKDAATIGGGAAGGAILGRILSKRGERSRGAVIGAIIGAAAGTAIASRTPGEEVVIAEGTVVDLTLDQDAEIRSRR